MEHCGCRCLSMDRSLSLLFCVILLTLTAVPIRGTLQDKGENGQQNLSPEPISKSSQSSNQDSQTKLSERQDSAHGVKQQIVPENVIPRQEEIQQVPHGESRPHDLTDKSQASAKQGIHQKDSSTETETKGTLQNIREPERSNSGEDFPSPNTETQGNVLSKKTVESLPDPLQVESSSNQQDEGTPQEESSHLEMDIDPQEGREPFAEELPASEMQIELSDEEGGDSLENAPRRTYIEAEDAVGQVPADTQDSGFTEHVHFTDPDKPADFNDIMEELAIDEDAVQEVIRDRISNFEMHTSIIYKADKYGRASNFFIF